MLPSSATKPNFRALRRVLYALGIRFDIITQPQKVIPMTTLGRTPTTPCPVFELVDVLTDPFITKAIDDDFSFLLKPNEEPRFVTNHYHVAIAIAADLVWIAILCGSIYFDGTAAMTYVDDDCFHSRLFLFQNLLIRFEHFLITTR